MKKIILTLCAIVFVSCMVQAQVTTSKDDASTKAYYQQKMEKAKKAEANKKAASTMVEKKVDPNNPPSNNEAEKQRLTELTKRAGIEAANDPKIRAKIEREKNSKVKIDN